MRGDLIPHAAGQSCDEPVCMPRDCPICETQRDDYEIVGRHVYGGKPHQHFYHCRTCDIAFLHPPMTDIEEAHFYAREFEGFMEQRSGEDADWSGPEAHIRSNRMQYERRLPFFRDLIVSDMEVLEVGCSSGFMLLPLQDIGARVFGVDPSEGFTSFLQDQGIQVAPSLDAMRRGRPADEGFDLILHFFVLEHIRYPEAFLKDLYGLLRPGGAMVFEVPSRDDPLITIYDIPAFHEFYWSVAHHYYFNRRSLENLLGKISDKWEVLPEQRYDLSNHMAWAKDGRPGGQGRYSAEFTPELDWAYRESMKATGHCDTLVAIMRKETDT